MTDPAPMIQADTKRKDWIQSFSGKQLFQRALRKEQAGGIDEIAHSLAGNFRFTRQTAARLSVAQHCVRGSNLLPAAFAGAFLLHELSEVYLPDIAGPLKPYVFCGISRDDVEMFRPFIAKEGDLITCFTEPDGNAQIPKWLIRWTVLEKQHTHVMLDALGLSSIEPLIYSPEVKKLDWEMLAAEKRDLFGAVEPAPWGLPHGCDHISYSTAWSPDASYAAFLDRFNALFK
jgi:hypothetical protein